MKTVIYTRVSSAEQVKGYSIDAQIEAARAWANEEGHNVVQVYVEPGLSARSDKRPTFQQMIDRICAGQASAVIVHKFDRFARNLLDLLLYKQKLFEHEAKLWSVTEPFLNDETAESDLFTVILGGLAEFTSDNIGRESKKGVAAMLAAGKYPGSHIPIGYLRIGRKRHATIEVCPIHGSQIRAAFQAFATGDYTIDTWRIEAIERGYQSLKGTPISYSAWGAIFRHHFYIGKFKWNGVIYQGEHLPVIGRDTWDIVNQLLEERNSGGVKKRHFWLLKGLLWSEHHARPMTGNMAKGSIGYYRAKGRKPVDPTEHNIRAEDAEAQVIALLSNIRAVSRGIAAPDEWVLALMISSNVGLIYHHLPTDQARQDLLRLVFLEHGLHVNRAGRVSAVHIRPGFEIINP